MANINLVIRLPNKSKQHKTILNTLAVESMNKKDSSYLFTLGDATRND